MPVDSSTTVLRTRLAELRVRHARLERELAGEFEARVPDAFRVARLKKRKLQVRDEIAEIERQLYPDIIA